MLCSASSCSLAAKNSTLHTKVAGVKVREYTHYFGKTGLGTSWQKLVDELNRQNRGEAKRTKIDTQTLGLQSNKVRTY